VVIFCLVLAVGALVTFFLVLGDGHSFFDFVLLKKLDKKSGF